ncbi:hypothetical protein MAP00_008534 [Monascus purpureus]|nr:hypothetical protein MAP00_008534 [Monascus purpureus]
MMLGKTVFARRYSVCHVPPLRRATHRGVLSFKKKPYTWAVIIPIRAVIVKKAICRDEKPFSVDSGRNPIFIECKSRPAPAVTIANACWIPMSSIRV